MYKIKAIYKMLCFTDYNKSIFYVYKKKNLYLVLGLVISGYLYTFLEITYKFPPNIHHDDTGFYLLLQKRIFYINVDIPEWRNGVKLS